MSGLDDRVVLVTGAGRGVGTGIAQACAADGATVVVTARRAADAQRVAQSLGTTAVGLGCDVTDRSAVQAAVAGAVDRFGRLDAVVHNATSSRSSEPHELESVGLEVWAEHADVALHALHALALAAEEPLAATGGALVVLVSDAGITGSTGLGLYGAAKGAQRGFVTALAREWGPRGIRVNGLAPLALTPALENAYALDPTMQPRIEGSIPLGRVGDSALDIGPTAAFLCSPASRYVTGQTLVVSGGWYTGLS